MPIAQSPSRIGFPHVSTSESTSRHGAGSTGAVQAHSAAELAARLDGRQVAAELFEQFRTTPEFGRSLTERVEPFHDSDSCGDLTLITEADSRLRAIDFIVTQITH